MIRSIAVVSTTAIRRNNRLGLRLVSQSSRISHHQHHPVLSTVVAGSASQSSTSNTKDSRWIILASLAGIAAAPLVIASCDDNKTDKEEEPDIIDILTTEEETEDPYDNLPEKDEPTHCSICMTYRQGPCRPYWRKVEACTKENELPKEGKKKDNEEDKENDKDSDKDKEDDDSSKDGMDEAPCFKYMLPWIECATGFRNLYNFIELDTNYTAGIVELEKDASEVFCWAPNSTKEPQVDWTAWQVYVESHPDWKLPPKKETTSSSTSTSTTSTSSTAVSLWKTLDQTKDPEAIEVTASVAVKQGPGGVLECAYAVDQDNHVIGFAYGTKPSQAAASADLEGEEDEDNSTVTLKIGLLPTHTRTVTIAAAYTQPPTAATAAAKQVESKASTTTTTTTTEDTTDSDADPSPPSLDSHIYKSRPFSVEQMGKKESTSPSSS